jgi:hypothetical protein
MFFIDILSILKEIKDRLIYLNDIRYFAIDIFYFIFIIYSVT